MHVEIYWMHVEIYWICLVKIQFRTGDAKYNFELSDKPCSGRPSLMNDDIVKATLEQDPCLDNIGYHRKP